MCGRSSRGSATPIERHDLHGLVDRGLLVAVRPARPCRRRRAPGPGAGSWVATPTGQLVGVAALRLDAADGHHHRPGGVGVVGALDQPLDDVVAGGDLAAGADPDPVAQPDADQRVVHGHQPLGQRHADVVLELQRGRAGAALGAVDDDEVRGDALLQHRLADGEEVDPRAHAELEAGRLAAGELAHPGDERDELARVWRRPGGTAGETHFSPCGTPRTSAISGVTLAAGSTPPMPGLAPWLSLSETHLTWSWAALSANLRRVEVAVLRAAAEVAGADLPDEVAAARRW